MVAPMRADVHDYPRDQMAASERAGIEVPTPTRPRSTVSRRAWRGLTTGPAGPRLIQDSRRALLEPPPYCLGGVI